RSLNGIDFSVIGRVEASGNSNSVKNYSFADTKLISGITRYFYRLKMVDFDYTLSHSEVRFVDFNSVNPVLAGVYPNPFKDQVSITLNSEETTTITVTICDINGREIIKQSLNTEEGLRIHSISTSNLNAGIYMMNIDNGVSIQHTRIVKN
ncbi:MAG: T9SS type A sorting domain-containing protein, partial [Bacteroidia bacterium]|nr:T9SS type A sorting domain-containing protein [Bacteroidia bacterium]